MDGGKARQNRRDQAIERDEAISRFFATARPEALRNAPVFSESRNRDRRKDTAGRQLAHYSSLSESSVPTAVPVEPAFLGFGNSGPGSGNAIGRRRAGSSPAIMLSWSTSPQVAEAGDRRRESRSYLRDGKATRKRPRLSPKSPSTHSTPIGRHTKRHRRDKERTASAINADTQQDEARATRDHAVGKNPKQDHHTLQASPSHPLGGPAKRKANVSMYEDPHPQEKRDDLRADLKRFLDKWKDKIDDREGPVSVDGSQASGAPRMPEYPAASENDPHPKRSDPRVPATRNADANDDEKHGGSDNIEEASMTGLPNSGPRDVFMSGALDFEEEAAHEAKAPPRSQHLPSRGFISQFGQPSLSPFVSLHYSDLRSPAESAPLYESQLRHPPAVDTMQGEALSPKLWSESRDGARKTAARSPITRGLTGCRLPKQFGTSAMHDSPQVERRPFPTPARLPQAVTEPRPRSPHFQPASERPEHRHSSPQHKYTTSELEFLQASIAGSDVDTPSLAAALAPDEVENQPPFTARDRDGLGGAGSEIRNGRSGNEQALTYFWQPNLLY